MGSGQRIKGEAKKAGENVRAEIEYLRTERPELYFKFINGARLDDLLDIVAGEKRLLKAVKAGVLR